MEPQSLAVQIVQLRGRVDSMEKTMDQHFQTLEKLGTFTANMGTWTAKHDEREEVMEEQQESRHKANSTKLNIIAVLAALGTVIIGAIGLMLTIETIHRSDLDPAKIFHSQVTDPEYAGSRYSATIPRLTR